MQRAFSVIRRRPNLVDVIIPVQAGVDGYALEKAVNFDAAYAALIPAVGFAGHVDDSLRDLPHQLVNGRVVRIIFDPALHGLTDTAPFWMRFVPSTGGVPGTPTPGVLIPPDTTHLYRTMVIQGDAPDAAGVGTALRIDFPMAVEDLRIRNLEAAGTMLYVATEEGGAEFQVPGGTEMTGLRGATPFILVRGDGGAVTFTASFTSAFPR